MREIKYRAAQTDNKGRFIAWIYGTPEFGDMGQLYIHHGVGGLTLCSRETLGQLTGLQDKNGKEIYEGDIFTYQGATKPCGPVVWNQLLLGWELKDSVQLWALRKDAEIIGNLYENPELLK